MEDFNTDCITALIYAYDYNREDLQVLWMLDEVIKRLQGINCYWSKDANIFYSFLVLLYGDYGTSPRSGWFEDEVREKLIDFLLDVRKRRLKEET